MHSVERIEQATEYPAATVVGDLPPAPRLTSELPNVPGYEVLGPLGEGGMGVVYQARQTALGRLVALKLIRPELGGFGPKRDEVAARFRTEATSIARLSHPNVVQVYEVGEWRPEGRPAVPFLAMEYVGGGSLAKRLEAGPLAAKDAAALVETLARAAHAAHLAGVVHRDLKPDNVLLTEDTTYTSHKSYRSYEGVTPKIADFGLARLAEAVPGPTEAGQILGTPSYMAPEQALARPDVGPSADIWALGAILYATLTGRPPFLSASALETLAQVAESEPAAPSRLNPATPRDLETIALKCLRKSPAERYRSAAELADDLERFQQGRSVLARPIGPIARSARWARRNPAFAAALAALLLTFAGGFAAVAASWRSELRQRHEAEAALAQTRRLLAGVVGQVYEDLRLADAGREPFPKAMAAEMLPRLEEYQHQLRGREDAVELARSEAWRGLLHWAAGRPREARSILSGALAVWAGPADEAARHWHALALMSGGDEASPALRRACDLARESDAVPVLAAALHDLGRDALRRSRFADAERHLTESAAAWESLSRPADRAAVEADLGRLFAERGDAPAALRHLDAARLVLTALTQKAPGDRRLALALANVYHETGRLLLRPVPVGFETAGAPADRTAALRQASALFDQGKETQATLAKLSNEPVTLAWLRSEMQHTLLHARILLGQRKMREAEAIMARAAPLMEQYAKLDAGHTLVTEQFRFETYLGVALAKTLGRSNDAKAALRRALVQMKRLDVDEPPRGERPRELAEAAYILAAALRNVKLPAEAVPAATLAARWQRRALVEAPDNLDIRKELSRTLFELGAELREAGRHADAAETARERAALWPAAADELHDGACELCMCARVPSATPAQREAYHNEAIGLLEKAVSAGLKGAAAMRREGDFSPLRGRSDFQKLVAEVEWREAR